MWSVCDDGRYVERVLCDWRCCGECCVMEGMWRKCCVMGGMWRECCVMGVCGESVV